MIVLPSNFKELWQKSKENPAFYFMVRNDHNQYYLYMWGTDDNIDHANNGLEESAKEDLPTHLIKDSADIISEERSEALDQNWHLFRDDNLELVV